MSFLQNSISKYFYEKSLSHLIWTNTKEILFHIQYKEYVVDIYLLQKILFQTIVLFKFEKKQTQKLADKPKLINIKLIPIKYV